MSAPLRAIIVDDEAPAREGLRIRLKREADIVVLGEFGDAAQALAAIRADPPDVLFLDIEMPGLDGFGLLSRTAGVAMPAVIFVTAHDAHAVRAFEVRALDYLLKPVEQDRLHEAIVRARNYWESARKAELADRMRGLVRDSDPAGASLPGQVPAPGGSLRIPVRRDGAIHFVTAADIDWIDAAGDSVKLHVGKATHSVRKSMGEMLAMLDPAQFLRIHRSTIVNVARVRELQPWFHGEYVVVLQDGTRLKLSRGYKENLSRVLGLQSD